MLITAPFPTVTFEPWSTNASRSKFPAITALSITILLSWSAPNTADNCRCKAAIRKSSPCCFSWPFTQLISSFVHSLCCLTISGASGCKASHLVSRSCLMASRCSVVVCLGCLTSGRALGGVGAGVSSWRRDCSSLEGGIRVAGAWVTDCATVGCCGCSALHWEINCGIPIARSKTVTADAAASCLDLNQR